MRLDKKHNRSILDLKKLSN